MVYNKYKMFEIAKNEWMNLFNEKSYTAWKDEDQKFRKFAMILSVLNEEFKGNLIIIVKF